MTKDEARLKLQDALDILEKTDWPDEVKADLYRMIAQCSFLLIANCHAKFIDGIQEMQEFMTEQLHRNMKRAQDAQVESRREKFTVVKKEDLN